MLAQFKAMIVSMFMAADFETAQPAINMDNIENLKEVACLSQAVYGEAGNQTFEGKVAVAHVILNRTRSDAFPSTICGVVRQRGQFDFIKHIKRIKDTPAHQKQMRDSVNAALMSINGIKDDPTQGSLFFANPKVATDQAWLKRLKKVVKIDDHWFYKRKSKPTRYRKADHLLAVK